MGTKLLACLCTLDNQGIYTSTWYLFPKSREPVCFSLTSLSVQGCVCSMCMWEWWWYVCVFFSSSLALFRPSTLCSTSDRTWGWARRE